mgnify:FL=1
MSAESVLDAGDAGSSRTGTKPGLPWTGANALEVFVRPESLRGEDSTTQRRTRLAFRPLDSAIAAVETPGARQAAMI